MSHPCLHCLQIRSFNSVANRPEYPYNQEGLYAPIFSRRSEGQKNAALTGISAAVLENSGHWQRRPYDYYSGAPVGCARFRLTLSERSPVNRTYEGFTPSRKGQVLLRRLGITIPFESTIEERALRIWHTDPQITRIQRAETVTYHLPDGTRHRYTPDFTLSLVDGRILSIECKPDNLLPAILANEPLAWHARAALLAQQDRPLYVVTDQDCSPARLQQALTFGRFYGYDSHAAVRQLAVTVLLERGAMTLAALKTYVSMISMLEPAEVTASLYGLLAAHDLVAEADVPPPACRVDVSGRSLTVPPTMFGLPMLALLQNPPPLPSGDGPVGAASSIHREEAFKASARGKRLLHLFTLYSDPTCPLDEGSTEHLMQATGVSRAGLFRFRAVLKEAGAPGVTFPELVPLLMGTKSGQPRRQTDLAVTQIIEQQAQDHYFVQVGTLARAVTLAHLHLLVRKACLAEELSPPAYTTVQRHVERIRQRDPVQAALLREGREQAQKLEARQGWLDLQRYGELIAVDCTPCDVFTLPDGEVQINTRSGRGKGQRRADAKRGNIVTVVDVMTSQVLRSVIFSGGIGAAQILLVLRELFLGDTQELQESGVQLTPQACGLPERIRMDGGTEFVNRQVARVLADLGIETLARNKWSRHHGGQEERVIGVLTHLHQLLPGTTTNNITNRGDYDAQRGALLTLTDLNVFHQRNVERHNQLCGQFQELTRHEHAAQLLRDGLSAWQPLSDTQRDYLQHRMRPMEVRRCDETGIYMHGLQYVSPELGPLIVRRVKVNVLFNPDDITQATAIHPKTGQPIELQARLPQGIEAPLSLKAWSELKARYRASKQGALDRAKTPHQIALEMNAERRERHATQKKPGQKVNLPLKNLTPDPVETAHGKSKIKAANIAFEFNPPVKA